MKSLRLMVVLFVVLTAATVFGATFNVTNPTEFQNALLTARSNGEDDVVNVAAGTYNLASALTYTALSTESYSLTIRGAGIGATILDGGNAVKLMSLEARGPDDSHVNLVIRGITFRNGNDASAFGGAMVIATNNGSVTVTSSEFSNNASSFGAGALFVRADENGVINVTNNIFNGNSSAKSAGAAELRASADHTDGTAGTVNLTNNTFVANSAVNVGGGVRVVTRNAGDIVNVYNNIIWGNTAALVYDLHVETQTDGAAVNLFNNDIADYTIWSSASLSEGNNINQAPDLTADSHLQTGSPCIDTGDNSAPSIPATDIDGGSRIVDGDGNSTAVVDMGADEFGSAAPVYAFNVPAMNEWGIIIFMCIAGLGGVRYLRRRA